MFLVFCLLTNICKWVDSGGLGLFTLQSIFCYWENRGFFFLSKMLCFIVAPEPRVGWTRYGCMDHCIKRVLILKKNVLIFILLSWKGVAALIKRTSITNEVLAQRRMAHTSKVMLSNKTPTKSGLRTPYQFECDSHVAPLIKCIAFILCVIIVDQQELKYFNNQTV